MISNEEFLKKFSRKIIAVGGDFKTAKTYSNNIGVFMGWGKFDSVSVLLCSQSQIEDYIIHLKECEYAPATINSFIAAIKRLYRINGKFANCKNLEYHDNPIQPPNILTYAECMAMCNAKIYLKHRVIINLLYYCALRRGELLRLKIQHLSSDNRLTVIRSKFGKGRVIPIPQNIVELIKEYLLEFNPIEYLFNGDKGTGMYSAKSVANIIDNTALLCGIQKNCYPHIMRSSCATHLLDNGASDMYVSEFLGHSDIQTTRDYYCRLTINGMQTNFNRAFELMNFNYQKQLA